ncbi:MAG: hypothetical protein LQ352_002838 [Teloschistes flavicans]|nr:MAG: hypothetical protein LQ352_002838 [Teloschistes flavicans]
MQGGGHGPAAHDFGLGADQVLEAEVVTSDGRVVTASPCQHSDLFFAIRGGGGGTYGVVLSTIVKAHPTTNVAAQQLSFAPLNSSYTSDFMKAVEVVHNAYPDLSDSGLSGYGSWSIASPTPLVYNYNYTLGGPIEANFTTGFTHTLSLFGKTAEEARSLFAPIATQLAPFNGRSLFINTTYSSFPTYAAFYAALSGIASPIGTSAAIGSRLLDRKALTSRGLNETLYTIAGTPEQFTSVNIIFVGGGQVARDGDDRHSGVNPAWRTSYVHNIVARGWAPGADEATKSAVYSDITNVKARAMKDLAPDTGAYMNEVSNNNTKSLQDPHLSLCARDMLCRQGLEWADEMFKRATALIQSICGISMDDMLGNFRVSKADTILRESFTARHASGVTSGRKIRQVDCVEASRVLKAAVRQMFLHWPAMSCIPHGESRR